MNVMVIGSGGREHAICAALKKSSDIEKLYVLPGNGGTREIAENINIAATDKEKIVEFAITHDIGFAVVTPDDPLAIGTVDALHENGIDCFGPVKAAALIESSKAFAKSLMKKYNIPTAAFEVFDDYDSAAKYLHSTKYPTVIKADGLALGKGVIIAQNEAEALDALNSIMRDKKFGESGNSIVIEEFLHGVEISALTLTDGKTVVPLASSMDHKRAHDGDTGANTGGMGAVAPNPYFSAAVEREAMEKIFLPTIAAMNNENRIFKGCLYFGLMLTCDGLHVIEYNCRFGDPETQAVLELLDTDLFTLMRAVEHGTLGEIPVKIKSGATCCVVLASDGYPAKYEKGFEIQIDDDALGGDITVFHAGTRFENGRIYTSGGRVINAVAYAPTLSSAIRDAYNAAEHIHFSNKYMRSDIGRAALAAKSED